QRSSARGGGLMTWELTEWEYTELTEYFESRDHFWQSEGNFWFRIDEGDPAFVLQVAMPDTGRFKIATITGRPMNWTPEAVEAHVTELLFKVTSLPFRLDVAAFLEKELGHPAEIAG